MKGELRPIGDVLLLPDNPRHGDIGAISQSLARFGQQKPIVVNSDGIILAGNHTYQAAKMLGWSEIWVVESELEGSDQTGFALADNRLSDLATYDHDVLLAQLQELDDLEGTGYDLEDMDELYMEVHALPDLSGDERYTPEWIFEAMAVEFDVDLAAPEGGIDYIPTKRWFTREDDALRQDWSGLFAWCNPPFSLGAAFAAKWVSEISDGVWLGPMSHGSQGVADLLAGAEVILTPLRLEFHHGDKLEGVPFPTYLAGYGTAGGEAVIRVAGAGHDLRATLLTPL